MGTVAVSSGTAATIGTVALSSGTATVSTTAVKTNSFILLTRSDGGGASHAVNVTNVHWVILK